MRRPSTSTFWHLSPNEFLTGYALPPLQYTTDVAQSASKLQSVTQEGDLDAFLSVAQLAATDFTAGQSVLTFGNNAHEFDVALAQRSRTS